MDCELLLKIQVNIALLLPYTVCVSYIYVDCKTDPR